ncbi:LppM family (lipo)protein [Butyrivibrio sp. FCS014]|uniref:LppM family (lipo)protein n=1 Tax=Butyrivibrio sp. FCS014 TaxID=1408304 RepID=UPI000465A4E5|nr:hypothetical protein [Butyrivibrio sp. FCS014]
MKKIRAVVLALVCMLSLSGCVRFNASIDVKKNGKVDVSMIYAAMSLEDYGFDGDMFDEGTVEDFEEDGWTVEPYSEGSFVGYKLIRKDVELKELADSLKDNDTDMVNMNSFKVTKDGLKYVIDWDLKGIGELSEVQEYRSYFDMSGGYLTVDINLPVKPSDHNATKVSDDGKSLEWDLLSPDMDGIYLEFTLFSFKWLFILGGIGLALAIIVVAVIIIDDNRRRKRLRHRMMNDRGNNPTYT